MPFKSDAQRKYFNANRKKLEAEGVDVDEWNAASKGMKLPKKAKKYQIGGIRKDNTAVAKNPIIPLDVPSPLPLYRHSLKQTNQLKSISGPTDTTTYLSYKKLLEENGSPKLNYNTNISRSNFNPLTNTMNLGVKDNFNFLGELAHSNQLNNLQENPVLTQLRDWFKSPYFNSDQYDKTQYTTPGTVENEAHSIIQPQLRERYINISDSIDDKKTGTYQFGGSNEDTQQDDNFFSTLYQAAQQQRQQQDQSEELPIDYNTEEPEQNDSTDYSDLQSQLEELKTQVANQNRLFNQSNDDFVNMLFTDDNSNNEPIIFGDTETNTEEPTFNYNMNLKGDSIAERHNNPGNIKYAPWMQSFGAVPGDPGRDGGRFAKFPTINAGLQARKELLTRPLYANKTVDSAMKLYSNNGYNGSIYPEISNKKMSELSSEELTELSNRQIKREDAGYAKKIGIKQAGGFVANTDEELHTGLNREDMSHMILNLPNTYNTIRGLDSNQPVLVMDGSGRQKILKGNKDTTRFKGRVYEIKI